MARVLSQHRWLKILLGCALGIGAILEIHCLRSSASFDLEVVFLFLWGMTPYLALLVVARLGKTPTEAIGAVVATLLGDIWGRMGFLYPTSSTAALTLIFLPFWLLVFFIPIGVYGTRLAIWLQGRLLQPRRDA